MSFSAISTSLQKPWTSPLTSTFLVALEMGLNHLVGLLALHNISLPVPFLRLCSFPYHIHHTADQDLSSITTGISTLPSIDFCFYQTASSAVSLPHSCSPCKGVFKSHILRKYYQANTFLLTLSLFWPPETTLEVNPRGSSAWVL